ncbi:MAG: hypothetical protein KJ731_21135 [Alphaproteobacteria bacterium]|uniref:Uncharacterized protein n=1 Tax=viral metagenome TaxID=1070528 RepID=A0A6M3JLP4_9ZZZZ|nr:hypothetical protein [Alphaproteobacteria bacterium]MBU1280291.1 hypothetical protein [Alphaproteobacteria bacterium]MBU1573030.1 hypothetical protein [Alphaproteobacteria bacterium]MBU1830956.1 hypothetical protein [Alphaproteobacteria bacterium]MBU2079989.1 hypothetical protein [Alphaproteobacteria bacterium]
MTKFDVTGIVQMHATNYQTIWHRITADNEDAAMERFNRAYPPTKTLPSREILGLNAWPTNPTQTDAEKS